MHLASWRFAALMAAMAALGFLMLACVDHFTALLVDGDDPQGEANAWCIKTELPSVRNGAGLIVTAHQTDCDVIGKDGAVYVYLQKEGQAENKYSLIFRYVDDPLELPPRIEWTSATSLSISVGRLSQITKQVDRAAGVNITYTIGKIAYP